MIFLTADSHLGHSNIIKYCNRPFETKEEHDQAIIDNWNSRVSKHDTVYHLGDFGFGPAEVLRKYADKLHGNIFLIKGNHDPHCGKEIFLRRFGWIKDYHVLEHKIDGIKKKIVLFHYACRSWQFMHRGGYHAFGHSHGNLSNFYRSIDVGVDCHNYTPVSLPEFIEKCETQYEIDSKKTDIDHEYKVLTGTEDVFEMNDLQTESRSGNFLEVTYLNKKN